MHEKGAKDAAAAAAKSAEGLADAVKRAKDAAANAQDNAGKTATDREAVAEMKTAAQTAQGNAEKSATAAAGSATSAEESAAAAETSRAGAAEIKAQIDEIKAGIDQAKADIDQTKTDTLAAKTAAETAAATATEKAAEIADSAVQIATNTENIGKNATQIAKNTENIEKNATGIETNATEIDLLRRENTELRAKTDALWKLSEGKSYDFVEDANEAYSKDVPTGGRFAQVEKIGGKTAVWNQWVDETKYIDATTASVTATISGRRITMAGTTGSRGENFYIIGFKEIWNVVANHYYLFAGISKLTGLNVLAYNGEKVITVAFAESEAKNAVFKPAFSGNSQLYFNTARAGVAVDVDCTPYLIDLTQLYGSGNEPTTADDPRIAEIIAYAEKHPEYNAGELVSAGVEDVEVQGENLIRLLSTTPPGFTKTDNGLTITVNADSSITVKGTATVDTYFNFVWYKQKLFDGIVNAMNASRTFGDYICKDVVVQYSSPTNETRLYLLFTVGDVDRTYYPQLVRATTLPPYSPYSLDTYPIPDAVKALPGYGWSAAGNLCNEIVRRADGWDYVQRVGLPATTDGYTAFDAPTTTDITDLMTGALPLMATEPGGTLTMHHALADDGLRLDVPNTIKYIRDLKEVASSGTE